MKAKIINFEGYNYKAKDTGLQKTGRSIGVITCNEISENDGNGNFLFGHTYESVYISPVFPMDDEALLALLGCDVELVYERRPGQRYERLIAILPLSEE